MAYSPNTADLINLILQGSTNVESIIRANSLDQMTAPAAAVSWNSQRQTNMGAGILSTDSPDLAQLAGIQLPYVISNCIWTADSPGSTRACSMTAGTVSIKGIQLTVAAVTSRSFTASDDTYIDLADNGDGTANITYTAVPNLQTSPALANSGTVLNTLRIGVISASASAVAASGICQGSITGVVNAGSYLSTTVAAGSTTQAIGTNPLNLAAVTHAPTGGGYVIWTAAGNGEQAILSYTGVSGSTLTGTTVLAGRAAATYTTGDTVKGAWPVGTADTIGNRIFRTNPIGGVSSSGYIVNAFTNTSTTANTFLIGTGGGSNGAGLYAPFVIPAGGGRQIRVSLFAPLLSSSAVAGTNIAINCWLDDNTISIATALPQVQVASDGAPLCLLGYSGLLTPGFHSLAVSTSQGAAGTLTINFLLATTYLIVDFV